MTLETDRRIWVYWKLNWTVPRIAAELGSRDDEVQARVNRIRQDPVYQQQLTTQPPPAGWELFGAELEQGSALASGREPYEGRHRKPPAHGRAALAFFAAIAFIVVIILIVVTFS